MMKQDWMLAKKKLKSLEKRIEKIQYLMKKFLKDIANEYY